MTRRVAILAGGWSAEREVSLNSGAAVEHALTEAGFTTVTIDVQRDIPALLHALEEARPDVVFNALHGRFGEDGNIQGLLNILAIPYTHSGLLASAQAMDKPVAKALFAAAGLPVADHGLIDRAALTNGLSENLPLSAPCVIKPANEGSSVGVHIVREGVNAPLPSADFFPGDGPLMVERYIPGRELTVSVLGDQPLTVTDITTGRGFYDYEAKYADGGSRHELPAQLDQDLFDTVMEMAVTAHGALGCRGVSRADFRFDESRGRDGLYILEVNTQPGMTATSLVPEQAQYCGISFPELVTWMVEEAQCDP